MNYEEQTEKFLGYAKEMWEAGVISEKKFRELSGKIKCWWFDEREIQQAKEVEA